MKRSTQYIGIAALIFLIFGVGTLFLLAQDEMMISAIHLVVGGILLGVFVIRGGLQIFLSSRVHRAAGFSAGVTLYSVLFIGVLAVANYIAARVPLFHYDSTEEKVYTLAPQTLGIISSLKEPVVIRAFFKGGKAESSLTDLLDRIQREGSKISWTIIDPDKKPQLAEKYGVNEDGSLHFSFESPDSTRVSKISGDIDEQAIANALIKLTRGGEKKVYTLVGDGERDLTSNEQAGYLFLKEAIEGENVKVEELRLSEVGKVPEDASAVLLLAPAHALPEPVQGLFFDYLEKGGNALIMTEPPLKNGIPAMVKRLGIEVGSDIVIDEQMSMVGQTLGVQPVIAEFKDHPVTQEIKDQKKAIILSTASSVRAGDPENPELTELAFTSPKSWAERDLDQIYSDKPKAQLDGDDLKGPVSIAVAFEGKVRKSEDISASGDNEKESRIIVVGDSDWVANINLNIDVAFNRDLVLNMVNWIIGEQEGISIRPRSLRRSVMMLTADQFSSMFLFGAILLPEALLLSGFAIWWFRKD